MYKELETAGKIAVIQFDEYFKSSWIYDGSNFLSSFIYLPLALRPKALPHTQQTYQPNSIRYEHFY
jgi:hypothetical protein